MFNIFLALLAGAMLSVQVGVNNALRGALGHPLWASLTSFLVGTTVLFCATMALRLPAPTLSKASLWMWTGGVLGAIYVSLSVALAPRLGAATLVGLIVAGQLVASIVVDHFGWLGFPSHPISPSRIAGAALLFAGVWLIKS